jgi:hypothetical protein
MTIEQAKECLNSIDLFAYGDEKNEYEFEEVKQAIKLSTKSLDMWDKVKEDIKHSQFMFLDNKKEIECIPIFEVMNIINKHLKEIEE